MKTLMDGEYLRLFPEEEIPFSVINIKFQLSEASENALIYICVPH